MSKIVKVVETAQLIHTLETFRDVLMKSHHEDIVAGVKVPKELKQHDEPVPYEHPHRELASKFVTDVHRRNKFEGARMSEKYLGIGEGGRALHPNAMPPDKRQVPVEKAVDHQQGVHTSGGFSGLEEKGQSQAGRNIQRATEPQPNLHLKALYHNRGVEAHRKILNTLKAMPKPNLPKTEVEKAMTVGPASVSSPLVIGNQGASTTQPQIIQSPNVMNPYLNKHGADHPVHKLLSSMKSRPKGN
jgi:hypothetical protein